jgi:uncharacterized RDD family membrane protein YckC/type II secretory pathway pseudopilin PulG
MPTEQQPVSSSQTFVNTVPQPQAPQISYAGFWLRFLAFSLDNVVVSVIIGIPIAIITNLFAGQRDTYFWAGVLFLFQIVLTYTYFIFLTNKDQATIGKRLLGLRVVSEDGSPLSLGKIIIRETAGKFISILILFIGFLMVAFTSKKQGLHDKMIGGVVLSNRAERKTWAYVVSIIVAAVLPALAILGILASVVLASLNVARSKAVDLTVKSNLEEISYQSTIVYNLNNESYKTMFEDPAIAGALDRAVGAVKTSTVFRANDTEYIVYVPLKKPTAPNTGWCVDSTGSARESVEPEVGEMSCPMQEPTNQIWLE